jgi:hypothetical protein
MTSSFDYNTAGEQRSFDLIPDGSVCIVQLKIRPGGAGEEGLLKRSKDGRSEGLDCEFVVVEGPHAKRKFFEWMTISGTTEGHAAAADITKRRRRAILESARGYKPTDASEAANKARVADWADFDGIRFMCRVGVEPGRDGYKDKNRIDLVITPDMKEWRPIEQVPTAAAHAQPAAAPGNLITKPAWAR